MNEERLQEIKARRAAITPGEWWVEYREYFVNDVAHYAPVVTTSEIDIADILHDPDADDTLNADAEFIANAANDIDALLAEIERLQRVSDWISDAPTVKADITVDIGSIKRLLAGETITVDPPEIDF